MIDGIRHTQILLLEKNTFSLMLEILLNDLVIYISFPLICKFFSLMVLLTIMNDFHNYIEVCGI